MNRPKTTRRRFLQSAALAGVGYWSLGASSAWGASRWVNEKLAIGVIGAGGKGYSDMMGVARTETIVAICDVDRRRADRAVKARPKAKYYYDFRKMLEKEKLDAVTISTPDHMHAPAATMAMELGLHVYVQKPLTHNVYEARQLLLLARKKKVATIMGNQGTSMDGFRRGVEVIRSGVLGKVKSVHVWTNRPGRFWKQGLRRPDRSDPVPEYLKWNLWLGVAPERPYVKGLYHPFNWRGWWDFGTGALGDMACHTMNLVYMGLQLGAPDWVEAQSDGGTEESPPLWSTITYHFPDDGKRGEVKLVWYDGEKDGKPNMPSQSVAPGVPIPRTGSMIVGTEGVLVSANDYGASYKLYPEAKFAGYKAPEPTLPRAPGHYEEWLIACKGGPQALGSFEYACPLTETVLLGNVAVRSGKRIHWDSKNLRVTNVPEANQYVRRTYRKGW